jgi:hypothetical protein
LDERTSIDSGGTKQFWVDQGFAIDYLIKIQVKQILILMNAFQDFLLKYSKS